MNTPILYLSYDGMTDPLGQSQVIPYLKEIAKKEFSITIVSFEKEENFRYRATIQDMLDEYSITWIPLKYTKKPPLLSTIWDIIKLNSIVKKQIRRNSVRPILHCRSYITSLVGLAFKRKKQAYFLFDMRGFWADERVEGGIWSLKNPIFRLVYQFFKKKEKQFLNESDHVISLTDSGKNEILNWEEIPNQLPISVIPCCADLSLFNRDKVDEVAQEKVRTELDIKPDQTVVTYLGSIGTWYMLPEMMNFFKILVRDNPSAIFLFITKESKEAIFSEADRLGIDRKSLRIQSAERREVPVHLSISSFSIFFIKPVFSKMASSPTKQGELMALGIPVICNSGVGDTENIVKQYEAGYIVHEFSDKQYESIVRKLTSSEKINVEKTLIGAKNVFGLERGVKTYLEVYKKIVGRSVH